jgi:hypothetical protein
MAYKLFDGGLTLVDSTQRYFLSFNMVKLFNAG